MTLISFMASWGAAGRYLKLRTRADLSQDLLPLGDKTWILQNTLKIEPS